MKHISFVRRSELITLEQKSLSDKVSLVVTLWERNMIQCLDFSSIWFYSIVNDTICNQSRLFKVGCANSLTCSDQ